MKWSNEEELRIQKLIDKAKVTKDTSWYRTRIVPKFKEHIAKYQKVSQATGVPTAMLMLIHVQEAGPDVGKFLRYLGNGQPWNKVTTIVPKNRGPFSSWTEGAIDAIRYDKLHEVTDWTLPKVLFYLEKYNGFGYRYKGINTPYVWSYTNHYTSGRYVRDGVYDPNALSSNIGSYALYLEILKQMPELEIGFEMKKPEEKVEIPQPEIPKAPELPLIEQIIDLLKKILDFLTKKPQVTIKADKNLNEGD